MKHNNIIRGIAICIVVLLIVLAVILATPAAAYEGQRITTKRQDALHVAGGYDKRQPRTVITVREVEDA